MTAVAFLRGVQRPLEPMFAWLRHPIVRGYPSWDRWMAVHFLSGVGLSVLFPQLGLRQAAAVLVVFELVELAAVPFGFAKRESLVGSVVDVLVGLLGWLAAARYGLSGVA